MEEMKHTDDPRSGVSRRSFIMGVIAGGTTVSAGSYLFRQSVGNQALAQTSASGTVIDRHRLDGLPRTAS